MGIRKLAHYSIRTFDLDASRQFYTDVLGFREGFRPNFQFPGIWLYQGCDEAEFGVVHIIGIDPNNPQGLIDYLGDRCMEATGSGSVDHIAFLADGLAEFRDRLDRLSITYRERTVPNLGLHQVFLEDPSGVTIELNYSAEEINNKLDK